MSPLLVYRVLQDPLAVLEVMRKVEAEDHLLSSEPTTSTLILCCQMHPVPTIALISWQYPHLSMALSNSLVCLFCHPSFFYCHPATTGKITCLTKHSIYIQAQLTSKAPAIDDLVNKRSIGITTLPRDTGLLNRP